MRGKIILICRRVVSYDFTLDDFVTVYFQKENCWRWEVRLEVAVTWEAAWSSRYSPTQHPRQAGGP